MTRWPMAGGYGLGTGGWQQVAGGRWMTRTDGLLIALFFILMADVMAVDRCPLPAA